MRILVVDDSVAMRSILSRIVRTHFPDAEVIRASSGAEVVCRIKSWEPLDLIILDWFMPGMSGAELLLRLQQHRNSAPIIILSPDDRPEEVTMAIRSGACYYVLRPFDEDDLISKISSCLGLPQVSNEIDPEVG